MSIGARNRLTTRRVCTTILHLRNLLPAALPVLLALALPAVASAITITPTTFGDTSGGTCVPGTSCSLRQATELEAPGEGKIILLKPGRYELASALQLSQNTDMSTSITVQGAGARSTAIDGNGTPVAQV